jgi:hypothetical protein
MTPTGARKEDKARNARLCVVGLKGRWDEEQSLLRSTIRSLQNLQLLTVELEPCRVDARKLLESLRGHKQLRLLSVRNQKLFDVDDDGEAGRLMFDLLCPGDDHLVNLRGLNLSRCILSPICLVSAICAAHDSPTLAKINLSKNIEMIWECGFADRWNDLIDDRPCAFHLMVALADVFKENRRLVEFDIMPPVPDDGEDEYGMIALQVLEVLKMIPTQNIAYIHDFSGSVDVIRVMCIYQRLENAARWTPDRHYLFSPSMHEEVWHCLLICNRFQVPGDITLLIIEQLARFHPIVNLACDFQNAMRERGSRRKEWTMERFFQKIGFDHAENKFAMRNFQEMQTAYESSDGCTYEDDRGKRSEADHVRDVDAVLNPVQLAFEEEVMKILRQDNSPLSTRLTFHSSDNRQEVCTVHLEGSTIRYESIPRAHVYVKPESKFSFLTLVVRTFFPPLAAPLKRVRTFVWTEETGVLKVNPNDCRDSQTQGGLLPPEVNTEYL